MFEARQGTQYWGSKDLLLPNSDQERFSGKSQALNEVTGCINPITSFVTLRNIVAIVIFTYQLILHNTSMIVLWNYCESIVARVYFPLSTNKALSWKGLLDFLHEGNTPRAWRFSYKKGISIQSWVLKPYVGISFDNRECGWGQQGTPVCHHIVLNWESPVA